MTNINHKMFNQADIDDLREDDEEDREGERLREEKKKTNEELNNWPHSN